MQAAERPPLVMTESAEWQEAERRRKARIRRFVRQCGANICSPRPIAQARVDCALALSHLGAWEPTGQGRCMALLETPGSLGAICGQARCTCRPLDGNCLLLDEGWA